MVADSAIYRLVKHVVAAWANEEKVDRRISLDTQTVLALARSAAGLPTALSRASLGNLLLGLGANIPNDVSIAATVGKKAYQLKSQSTWEFPIQRNAGCNINPAIDDEVMAGTHHPTPDTRMQSLTACRF